MVGVVGLLTEHKPQHGGGQLSRPPRAHGADQGLETSDAETAKTAHLVCWHSRTRSPVTARFKPWSSPRACASAGRGPGCGRPQAAAGTPRSPGSPPTRPPTRPWAAHPPLLPKELGKLRDFLKFTAPRPGTYLPTPRCPRNAGGGVRWGGASLGGAKASLRAHPLAPGGSRPPRHFRLIPAEGAVGRGTARRGGILTPRGVGTWLRGGRSGKRGTPVGFPWCWLVSVCHALFCDHGWPSCVNLSHAFM